MNYGMIVAELRLLETICRHSGGKDEIALLAKNAADAIENLDDICQRQADEIRKLKNQWVPVTERMPEMRRVDCEIGSYMESDVVAVYCYDNTDEMELVLSALYEEDLDDDGFKGWVGYDGYKLINVTHWMPMPEPPKDGE